MTETRITEVMREGVAEFLRDHAAEGALQQACARIETCFPEARSIVVSLLEDPDEGNHTWIVLTAILPVGHPADVLRQQRKRYYEAEGPNLPYHPFSFSLATERARE